MIRSRRRGGYESSARSVAELRPPPRLPAPTAVQNNRGDWVPAIPLPRRHLVVYRCTHRRCKAMFFNAKGYMGHYALAHILHLDRA